MLIWCPASGVFRISKRGRPNVCWPLALTQGGPNQVFQVFYYVNENFFAKGGHGRFGQRVNTPLCRASLEILCRSCHVALVLLWVLVMHSKCSMINYNSLNFDDTSSHLYICWGHIVRGNDIYGEGLHHNITIHLQNLFSRNSRLGESVFSSSSSSLSSKINQRYGQLLPNSIM